MEVNSWLNTRKPFFSMSGCEYYFAPWQSSRLGYAKKVVKKKPASLSVSGLLLLDSAMLIPDR